MITSSKLRTIISACKPLHSTWRAGEGFYWVLPSSFFSYTGLDVKGFLPGFTELFFSSRTQ